jgi:hypothetical protein
MSKQALISIVVVLLVGAGMYGAYEFYVKEQLETYKANDDKLVKRISRLQELDKTFDGVKPDLVVTEWSGSVEPWKDEVRRRSEAFNLGDWTKTDPVPEGILPKFYYEEQLTKLLNERMMMAREKGQWGVPMGTFGSPLMQDLSNQTVKAEQVGGWIGRLKLANGVTKLLLDANPMYVTDISLWQPANRGANLKLQTVGYAFAMNLDGLTKFIESLSRRPNYVDVEAIKISTPTLVYPDPPLHVEMVVTFGMWQEAPVVAAGAAQPNANALQNLRNQRGAAGRP